MRAREVRRDRHALPKFAATTALLGMALATPLGGDVLRSSVQAAQRAADLIDARSPGARSETGLIKSKRRADAAPAAAEAPRTARALSGAREAPVAPPAEAGPAPFVPAIAERGPPSVIVPASAEPGGGVFGGPGGGFVSFSPVGSPGGGSVGGGGVVIAPSEEGGTVPGPPVVTPVPEPASWLMLILGFGAMGSALRWRSRDGYRAT